MTRQPIGFNRIRFDIPDTSLTRLVCLLSDWIRWSLDRLRWRRLPVYVIKPRTSATLFGGIVSGIISTGFFDTRITGSARGSSHGKGKKIAGRLFSLHDTLSSFANLRGKHFLRVWHCIGIDVAPDMRWRNYRC